jgi:hypothetical protein
MPDLNWKLSTRKRGSSMQGLPPGKEDLAWVTNTVTLIYGERDAILVDTFLSVEHSNELIAWIAENGRESYDDLHHARAWRPFPGPEAVTGRFLEARAFATAPGSRGQCSTK